MTGIVRVKNGPSLATEKKNASWLPVSTKGAAAPTENASGSETMQSKSFTRPCPLGSVTLAPVGRRGASHGTVFWGVDHTECPPRAPHGFPSILLRRKPRVDNGWPVRHRHTWSLKPFTYPCPPVRACLRGSPGAPASRQTRSTRGLGPHNQYVDSLDATLAASLVHVPDASSSRSSTISW